MNNRIFLVCRLCFNKLTDTRRATVKQVVCHVSIYWQQKTEFLCLAKCLMSYTFVISKNIEPLDHFNMSLLKSRRMNSWICRDVHPESERERERACRACLLGCFLDLSLGCSLSPEELVCCAVNGYLVVASLTDDFWTQSQMEMLSILCRHRI